MNDKRMFLMTALTVMLASGGCDLLDFGTTEGNTSDDNGGSTGDDDGEGDTHDDPDHGSESGSQPDDEPAADTGTSGSAEDTGEITASASASEEGLGESGTGEWPSEDSSGFADVCDDGFQVCLSDTEIAACIDGELIEFSCQDACVAAGYSEAVGCEYDEESGVDMCLCQ